MGRLLAKTAIVLAMGAKNSEGSLAQAVNNIQFCTRSSAQISEARIPMAGRGDSINVAVAAGVLLYEIFNQRRGA